MSTPPTFPVEPATDGKTNEILIHGERHELGSTDIIVRTYDQPHAHSFYRESPGADGLHLFGRRFEKPGVPVTTFEQLVEHIHQVVIHTDLTSDSTRCFRVLAARSLSSHFLVDWDGVLWQPLDVMDNGYHAGEANSHSIGVDMNNRMKNLEREPDAPPYEPSYDRIGEVDQKRAHRRPISDRMVINGAKVRSYGYTDAQYTTLIELLRVLTTRFPKIKVQYPSDEKGDVIPRTLDDPLAHQGFMAHWHWELQRWDPGPAFDWQRVFHALGNEHNAFPIELEAGKNIKSLLEPDKVREYAKEYYRNNELETLGWYPMGINQTWNGGILLAAPRGSLVYAMTDGVLVAAHFSKESTRLGSNNFVLLKHEVPMPTRRDTQKAKNFVFYSLYMHLDCLDTDAMDDPDIPWLKELTRIDKGKDDGETEYAEQIDEDADPYGEEAEELADACDTISDRMWLEIGNHTAALKLGKVAKIAYEEDPIHVLANQPIGRVGLFGQPNDWRPQVKVAVFADAGWKEVIDIGIHGRHLVEATDDVSSNLFVQDSNITSLFGFNRGKPRNSLVAERTMSPSTIEGFWLAEDEYQAEKEYLRKLVTRHVSEWSDQVDWVSSLSSADGWDYKTDDFRRILRGSSIAKDAIATVLPFIWLSKDMAEHIGLDTSDWRGILDHFHPINFLMWLTYHSTQRIQTLSSSTLTPKQAKAQAARAEKERERCRTSYRDRTEAQQKMEAGDADAAKCFDLLTDEDRGESTVAISDYDEVPEVNLMEEWLDRHHPGEWRNFSTEDI